MYHRLPYFVCVCVHVYVKRENNNLAHVSYMQDYSFLSPEIFFISFFFKKKEEVKQVKSKQRSGEYHMSQASWLSSWAVMMDVPLTDLLGIKSSIPSLSSGERLLSQAHQ